MMEIPKFCAVYEDDVETICSYGSGETVEKALAEFLKSGELHFLCAMGEIPPGGAVEIKIYSVIPIDQSDWPEDERDPKWDWCLDDLVETRMVKAPPTEEAKL